MTDLRLDLKVCEGCGALWLRATMGDVYCRRCRPMFGAMRPARGRRRESCRSGLRLVKSAPMVVGVAAGMAQAGGAQ